MIRPPIPQNILRNELIGLTAEVVLSSNTCVQNIRGKVIDETMNTLVIKQNGKQKAVNKKNTIFKFNLNGESVKVNGSKILGRPEERVKLKKNRKW